MADYRDREDKEPIRLVDEDDRSLTLVDNHVEGSDDGEGLSAYPDINPNDPRVTPSYEEETAIEYANGMNNATFYDKESRETANMNPDDVTAGRGVGTFAIVLSILSLFFLPILLGAAGIVIGFISRRAGSTGLGNWAIGIGAISILMTVFFSPFF